jgi:leader peptidase (prepilin peptidase)/N-methyltransferase
MTVPPEPVASIFLLAVGLVLGSFLNVCIYRLPVGESVVRPRSRCRRCQTEIPWYRNVPVVSWFVLRGRCGSCGARISWRYPLVEALAGAIVLGCWMGFGPTAAFPISVLLALALVVLFFTDLDHQLLPDAVTLSGLGVGLAVAWVNPFLGGQGWQRLLSAGAGALLGAGLLWGLGAIYSRLRGVDAMGMGDVKMMGMVGSFTGPFGVLLTIFAASLVGALVGILLVPLRGRTLQDTLPFGCFLAPAAMIALLYGRRVMEAYLGVLAPFP